MADQAPNTPKDAPKLSKTERREYQVGVITAAVLVAVFVLTVMANRGGQKPGEGGFTLTAAYYRADGVHIGTPVRIAGMNIGVISAAALDERQRAVLTFRLDQPIQLPDDTAAVIETDGIFGTKYIEFRPGGSDDILKSGGRINYTQDSVIIEDLVSLIVRQAKGAKGIVDPPATESEPPQ
ncbi:MAG: MlaD family protein [Rhodospirillaceae bacterium]|nr:MlaD family protein [Rhodospirillaceae bacterium]